MLYEVITASDDMDRKMLETIGTKDIKRMRLNNSAISRIGQGKYGLCMKCGKRIPKERLEAIPYALMCIECQSVITSYSIHYTKLYDGRAGFRPFRGGFAH